MSPPVTATSHWRPRRGAKVVATDFSNAMIDNGRARTREAGIEIDWRPADAEDLPFPDGAFDFVTSVFGVMFAGDQSRARRRVVPNGASRGHRRR